MKQSLAELMPPLISLIKTGAVRLGLWHWTVRNSFEGWKRIKELKKLVQKENRRKIYRRALFKNFNKILLQPYLDLLTLYFVSQRSQKSTRTIVQRLRTCVSLSNWCGLKFSDARSPTQMGRTHLKIPAPSWTLKIIDCCGVIVPRRSKLRDRQLARHPTEQKWICTVHGQRCQTLTTKRRLSSSEK